MQLYSQKVEPQLPGARFSCDTLAVSGIGGVLCGVRV